MLKPRGFSSPVAITLTLASATLASQPATAQTDVNDVDHAQLRDRSLAVLEADFSAFRDAGAALADASGDFCGGDMPRDTYLDVFKDTWRAWAPLGAYQFGPVEQRAAVLTLAFWPDKKDYVGRGLEALLALPAESLSDPQTIVKGSAAAQGLPAIERLVFSDLQACPAIIGISANVESMGALLYDDWFSADGWADLMRAAGPGNPVYQSDAEVTKALFTAITYELSVIAATRLGRPLGTFDVPRGTHAEAWRAGLSFDIIDTQMQSLADLLDDGFAAAVPEASQSDVLDAIQDVRTRIADFEVPLDEAVTDPITRFRVEGLQTQVTYVQTLFMEQVGPGLGVESGFSPADGD